MKKKKKKIRRRCKCGDCGLITKPGNKYIHWHHKPMLNKKQSKEFKKNMSIRLIDNTYGRGNKGRKQSKEQRLNNSLAQIGNTNALGYKLTKEQRLKNCLAHIQYDPNYSYCDIWKDGEYKKDLRKDHCENKNCKRVSKRFVNHHIYLDKKRCAPNDIMTLCASCHAWLHAQLQNGKQKANPKDFIIINRPDHVTYINKKTRKKVLINKIWI